MRGPIDFIIVGFDGPKFDGKILSALSDSLDAGVIDLVALTLINKDKDGKVTQMDVADSGDRHIMHFAEKYDPKPSMIEDDDVTEASDLLENGTAAGLLVIEHVWARPLKKAILESGGVLVAEGRIHPEAEAQLSMKEN
jgi:hypothetical protein